MIHLKTARLPFGPRKGINDSERAVHYLAARVVMTMLTITVAEFLQTSAGLSKFNKL